MRMLSLLIALVIVGFSLKVAVQGGGGGDSGAGGGTLAPDVTAQAQSICSQAFTPPLIRFPPDVEGAASAAAAAQARSTIDTMLGQLEPAITSRPVSQAFTLITSYRNLLSALAAFPPDGGEQAEQNVMQLATGVSSQAQALGIPACAPG
ncbi:MAG: hypothetical protein ACJ76Z_03175 [Thermoleophilaceae bacterium]